MIPQAKMDAIINAANVGMTQEDAYVYAGLTPLEVQALDTDDAFQRKIAQLYRANEYKLLAQMGQIADKQVRLGKESATAWLLEKLYPRYSSKPQENAAPVTINLNSKDPLELDTVSVDG